jgi:hypothetical protein
MIWETWNLIILLGKWTKVPSYILTALTPALRLGLLNPQLFFGLSPTSVIHILDELVIKNKYRK